MALETGPTQKPVFRAGFFVSKRSALLHLLSVECFLNRPDRPTHYDR